MTNKDMERIVYSAAKDFFSWSPGRWDKGPYYAKTLAGDDVHWRHPTAFNFCVIGICNKIAKVDNNFHDIFFDQLTDLAKEKGFNTIAGFNDFEGTSLTQVIDIWE
jgi:hypothetical protein